MAFSQSTVSGLALGRSGADLVASWSTTAPAGTVFQVYLGRRLAWWGPETSARFPWPQSRVAVDVGAVGAGEGPTDFSGSLPSAPSDRVALAWSGGTYLAPTGPALAGFRIYRSPSAGAAVSYASPVDTVPAYHGAITDGYGLGAYDAGGWGLSASDYSWTSEPLGPGVWSFAVVPYDAAGNEGAGSTWSATVATPPRPPAPFADGSRLFYTFDAPTRVPTLHWQVSPS